MFTVNKEFCQNEEFVCGGKIEKQWSVFNLTEEALHKVKNIFQASGKYSRSGTMTCGILEMKEIAISSQRTRSSEEGSMEEII